jgi:hypothetical protein
LKGALIGLGGFLAALVVAAALLYVRGAPVGSGPATGAAPVISAAGSRAGPDLVVVITLANRSGRDLGKVQLTRAMIGSTPAFVPLPLDLGDVDAGGSASVSLRFRGSAPPPGMPVQLEAECRYKVGWFGHGMAQSTLTLAVP